MHLHPDRHGVHIANAPHHRPGVVSRHRLPHLHLTATEEPTLVKRGPAPAESGSKNAEKASSSTQTATLPVVLGAVVPIVVAIVVLLVLHRRHVKKLRNEDANDKHKSLDFGMDIVEPSSRRGPMRETEKPFPSAHTKGISLDVGPYLVPSGMQSSRDSLHSMSMSAGDDGKYRPANTYFQNDASSIRSYPRGPQDDASSLAGSTNRLGLGDDMDQGLLGNAQRMSRSSPPLYNMPPTDRNAQSPPSHGQVNPGFQLDLPRSSSPFMPFDPNDGQTSEMSGAGPGLHMDNHAEEPYGYPLPDNRAPYPDSAHAQAVSDNAQPPSIQPPRISLPESDVMSDPADNRKSTFIVPDVNVSEAENGGVRDSIKPPEEPSQRDTLAVDPRRDTRRMTLGLRPLPPEDPSDNPEQRANRIRSFYKEYFDESKPGRETQYYEDYGPEMYDSVIYDDYYPPPPPRPFAEPVGRRAMTPPPRAPPRFQGPPRRHMASGSMGGFSGPSSPGPRAFSSASGRLPGARGPPRKPAPPPSPLQELPTPHMLSKDEAIMQAADFAPGKNFRDQKDGRAGTPLGGLRPFSPMTPIASPLASPFDELSAMPSPHALRKSGTFTNLDFAPPPRFKNETDSDAGSIRSNRSGISNTHMHNIRTGAYRVSRLDGNMVGTRDDMMSSLRPTWDMRK